MKARFEIEKQLLKDRSSSWSLFLCQGRGFVRRLRNISYSSADYHKVHLLVILQLLFSLCFLSYSCTLLQQPSKNYILYSIK